MGKIVLGKSGRGPPHLAWPGRAGLPRTATRIDQTLEFNATFESRGDAASSPCLPSPLITPYSNLPNHQHLVLHLFSWPSVARVGIVALDWWSCARAAPKPVSYQIINSFQPTSVLINIAEYVFITNSSPFACVFLVAWLSLAYRRSCGGSSEGRLTGGGRQGGREGGSEGRQVEGRAGEGRGGEGALSGVCDWVTVDSSSWASNFQPVIY